MTETPAAKIRALKEEYSKRSLRNQPDAGKQTEESASPPPPGVGHIWFDSSTNQLWVCTGRINGKLKWSKVSEGAYE